MAMSNRIPSRRAAVSAVLISSMRARARWLAMDNKTEVSCLGLIYLVDSGYPNRIGYLAPFKGTKYHLPEFRQGPHPRGKKEVFNFIHSSLRSIIERAFGVLKMKWRILLDFPSYPFEKQSKIIIACMALHNFIRESALEDVDFDRCDGHEEYMPFPPSSSSHHSGATSQSSDEDQDMNIFLDNLAHVLFPRRR